MSKRIYVVTGQGRDPRLVNAASQHQAVGFVVRDAYKAKVATQSELVEFVGKGVKVEEVSDDK